MMMMLLRELINIHILPTGYETLFTLAVSAPHRLPCPHRDFGGVVVRVPPPPPPKKNPVVVV